MAKKNNHWYVLVMSNKGPKFVTKINYSDKTAEWNEEEKPLKMDKMRAEDLTFGLNMNFHNSYTVVMPFELETQPYNYKEWMIEWKEKEEKNG